MPPACRFTREQIVAAALAITRERGFDAVTARAIADTLHSSSKVIFSAFSGMDDLLAATIDAADAQYRAYSADFVRDSADPPYKAVGTAYIRFARKSRTSSTCSTCATAAGRITAATRRTSPCWWTS